MRRIISNANKALQKIIRNHLDMTKRFPYLFDLSSEGIALCVDVNLCHCCLNHWNHRLVASDKTLKSLLLGESLSVSPDVLQC